MPDTRPSWWQILLPLPITAIWALLMVPLSLGTEIFDVPAVFGAAAVLSLSRLLCRRQQMAASWQLMPFLTWLYEMLPVNIPGPVDEYLAFGGAATVLVVQFLWANGLGGSTTPPTPPAAPTRPSFKDEGPIIDVTSTVVEDRSPSKDERGK